MRLKGQDFAKNGSFLEFQNEIQREFSLITSRLKRVELQREFKEEELENLLQKSGDKSKNIFELYKQGKNNKELSKICESYVSGARDENEAFSRWYSFAKNYENVKREFERVAFEYENNIELVIPQNTQNIGAILPLESVFSKSGYERNVEDWIWQRADSDDKFSFDSEAEEKWLKFLLDLKKQGLVKEIAINKEKIYLLGKNYPYRSNLKFEYYLNGYHFSYPDFIMKDWQDRIHIFEVKSANQSKMQNIDSEEYEAKIKALKQCYKAVAKKINASFAKQDSIKTYHFYIPNLSGVNWNIWRSEGEAISQNDFKSFLKN